MKKCPKFLWKKIQNWFFFSFQKKSKFEREKDENCSFCILIFFSDFLTQVRLCQNSNQLGNWSESKILILYPRLKLLHMDMIWGQIVFVRFIALWWNSWNYWFLNFSTRNDFCLLLLSGPWFWGMFISGLVE